MAPSSSDPPSQPALIMPPAFREPGIVLRIAGQDDVVLSVSNQISLRVQVSNGYAEEPLTADVTLRVVGNGPDGPILEATVTSGSRGTPPEAAPEEPDESWDDPLFE